MTMHEREVRSSTLDQRNTSQNVGHSQGLFPQQQQQIRMQGSTVESSSMQPSGHQVDSGAFTMSPPQQSQPQILYSTPSNQPRPQGQYIHTPTQSFQGTHHTLPHPPGLDYVALDQKLDALFHRVEKLVRDEVGTLKTYIDDKLQEKMQELTNYVDQEVGKVTERVRGLEGVTAEIREDLERAKIFAYETTVVAEHFPFEEGEDLHHKVTTMLRRDLSVHVPIVRTTRLKAPPPRDTRQGTIQRHGIVKIQFRTVEDKVSVLQVKRNLQNSPDYSRVWLRSSKSHSERIMEQNMKTLIATDPKLKDYTLTAHGKLVKRQNNINNTAARNAPQNAQ